MTEGLGTGAEAAVVEGDGLGVGLGVAADVPPASCLASVSARASAAASFFCATPYAAKSLVLRAAWPSS